ncbi:MAG: AgmX/PglI C-terminal domain-containing protein [Deltaproteobacteria bacterium]|nr:AgmX/PglI C-terminal domain-containing protein [Deltaproteobacteria bacterium]
MAAKSRLMRVGVVVRGTLVCERVVDAARGLTVGSAADATLRLEHQPGLPDQLAVLHNQGGELVVQAPAEGAGRLRMRRGGEGHLVPAGQAVPLRDQGGSLAVGEVLVLFQPTAAGTPMRTRREPVLHMGLVFEDRLIDDRTWPLTQTIRVGCARRDTVVLPAADYAGPPLTLTPQRDGSVLLTAPVAAGLRLAGPDAPPQPQDVLLSSGRAQRHGEVVHVRLQVGSRARLRLGAHTLLVQVVMQTVTVPQLPHHTLLDRLVAGVLGEPAWWASLAASLLLLGSLAVQAHRTYADPGLRPLAPVEAADEHTEYSVEVPMRETETPPEPQVEVPPAAPAPQPALAPPPRRHEQLRSGPQVPRPPTPVLRSRPAPDPQAAIRERTLAGTPGLNAPRIYADAADGSEGALTKPVFGGASGEGGDSSAPAPAARSPAALSEPRRVAKAPGDFGPRDQEAVRSAPPAHRERPLPPLAPPTGPEIDEKPEIARAISRKHAAIQRCYDQALRDNPSEGGKVRVTFTVGTEGSVTEVSVAGGSPGLVACIEARFLAIRGLPALKGEKVFVQTYVLSRAE